MKQIFAGLLIGAVIGAFAMWAIGATKPVPPSPEGLPNPGSLNLLAYDSTKGNDPGGGPINFVVSNSGLPAGSSVVFMCNGKNCIPSSGAAPAGAGSAHPNVLFELVIPSDLPANAKIGLSYRLAPGKQQASR